MHRNEMKLLAPFAKVNKRGVGKKYKKINKHPPSCIKHTRVDLHSFTQFINISFTTSMWENIIKKNKAALNIMIYIRTI